MSGLWGLRGFAKRYWTVIAVSLVVMTLAGGLNSFAIYQFNGVFKPLFETLVGPDAHAQAEQMNSVVGELIALVGDSSGGSGRASGTDRSSPRKQQLNITDHTFHKIAHSEQKAVTAVKAPVTRAAATGPTKAEKVIPLDDADSGSFGEFNSNG